MSRDAERSGKIAEAEAADAKGLFLLFATGKRPDRAAIRDFISSQRSVTLTHDPADGSPLQLVAENGDTVVGEGLVSPSTTDIVWLELLRDGLAFDLRGLAPRGVATFPDIEHRFDLDNVPGPARFEALQLLPGNHLSGGERSLPVVKALMALARDLTHHFADLEGIVWPPSGSAIGRRFFESVSTAWLEGGPFPALGLTAFRETVDGALQSVGLDFWIDQELRIEPPLSADKVAATRLGVRLVNQMIIVGGLEQSERIVSPDGTRLLLSLSRNRKFIRVSRE